MAAFFSTLALFLPIILTLAFFVVSLVLYIRAKKTQTQDETEVSPARLKTLRVLLIVSSIMLGLQLLAIAVLVIMLYFAVAYM